MIIMYLFLTLMKLEIAGDSGPKGKKEESGSKRRRKKSEEEEAMNVEDDIQKPRDVVHVRAKRGQATDSHSLAERVIHQIFIQTHNNFYYFRMRYMEKIDMSLDSLRNV